jgi:DNA-binding IclR family transcriptional regulator
MTSTNKSAAEAGFEQLSAVPGRQSVPSVRRAVAMLNVLASGPPSATLASLSKTLGIPRSSALALCNTLVATGLMRRAPDGSYRLGAHTLELSRAYLGQTGLHAEFERAVGELGTIADYTLVLSVLDGTDVVYVGRRNGSQAAGVTYELGMRLPAHCTASGKAMLCQLAPDDVRQRYRIARGATLPALTAKSITSVSELIADLSLCQKRGYATDDEETALGMFCVGAAIRDDADRIAGAVALSLVKAAVDADGLERTANEVVRIAARISAALGAPRAATGDGPVLD